jgi:hypothetical protein
MPALPSQSPAYVLKRKMMTKTQQAEQAERAKEQQLQPAPIIKLRIAKRR